MSENLQGQEGPVTVETATEDYLSALGNWGETGQEADREAALKVYEDANRRFVFPDNPEGVTQFEEALAETLIVEGYSDPIMGRLTELDNQLHNRGTEN